MPSSKDSEDLRPCGNLNGVRDSSEDEANRLNKLENEVYRLREEVDKIKWQRAAAETAIERAIVRGAAALGDRYKILVPDGSISTKNNNNDNKKFANTDGASNESIASNDSRLSSKKSRNFVPCDKAASTAGTNVKGKKANACGQYTLG